MNKVLSLLLLHVAGTNQLMKACCDSCTSRITWSRICPADSTCQGIQPDLPTADADTDRFKIIKKSRWAIQSNIKLKKDLQVSLNDNVKRIIGKESFFLHSFFTYFLYTWYRIHRKLDRRRWQHPSSWRPTATRSPNCDAPRRLPPKALTEYLAYSQFCFGPLLSIGVLCGYCYRNLRSRGKRSKDKASLPCQLSMIHSITVRIPNPAMTKDVEIEAPCTQE